jgi:hypothetical protein
VQTIKAQYILDNFQRANVGLLGKLIETQKQIDNYSQAYHNAENNRVAN